MFLPTAHRNHIQSIQTIDVEGGGGQWQVPKIAPKIAPKTAPKIAPKIAL